jgi:hypothetical protein
MVEAKRGNTMTNETKKIMADDEYQFPNQEYVNAEQVPPPEHETLKPESSSWMQSVVRSVQNIPLFQNKRIVFTVLAVIVIVVMYKVMAPSHKTHPVPQTSTTSQQQINQGMMSRMDDLQRSESGDQSALSSLKDQMQSLTNQLTQSNATQAQLAQGILAIANQVKSLTDEVQELSAKTAVKPKKPVVPKIVYHLQSVIPGRAWIEDSEGGTNTVRVGDNLPQYGTVESIDSNRGILTTSSGRVIVYGQDDS